MNILKLLNISILREWILGKDSKVKIIFITGMLGIVLVLMSSYRGSSGNKNKSVLEHQFDINSYQFELESKILKIVENVDGVGQAKIMITLENSFEYVYAQEERKKIDKVHDYRDSRTEKIEERDDEEQKLILVDSVGGKRQALIKTQIQPKVKGVVVVCTGGGDSVVNQRITNLITTLLHIPSTRVYVTKGP